MAFVLDTADLPARDRVAAVHAAMMSASAPCHVFHEAPDGDIHARMGVWHLGAADVFTTRSSGIRLLRTAKQAAEDASPIIALSVQQLSHGHHEQFGRRQVLRPGDLLAVDLSGPYEYSWAGDGAAGCIQIPVDRLALPVDVIRGAAGNLRASPLYGMVTQHIAHLAGNADRLSADPAAPTLGAASIELARALLASASHTERHARAVLAETLLTRVRAYVRQHLADPGLRPATIAAAHNVSLRHLYKTCAQADFSLEQWIIGERLHGAREELRRPASHRHTIAVIARRWGFVDPTHFARRFRAMYGITPRDWRRINARQAGSSD